MSNSRLRLPASGVFHARSVLIYREFCSQGFRMGILKALICRAGSPTCGPLRLLRSVNRMFPEGMGAGRGTAAAAAVPLWPGRTGGVFRARFCGGAGPEADRLLWLVKCG